MRSWFKLVSGLVVVVVVFVAGMLFGSTGIGQAVDPASLEDRERAFAERMQNVALVGQFTIDGRESSGEHPERYEIERVVKVDDNSWRFDARIIYGSTDVTLPVRVPIEWAGDTPVISITDFTIPTLGTFTARVMFYDDRYAGSWQHGEFEGLMYGTIER
jgi:hypothetical protein